MCFWGFLHYGKTRRRVIKLACQSGQLFCSVSGKLHTFKQFKVLPNTCSASRWKHHKMRYLAVSSHTRYGWSDKNLWLSSHLPSIPNLKKKKQQQELIHSIFQWFNAVRTLLKFTYYYNLLHASLIPQKNCILIKLNSNFLLF